ncbi:hypothetical protein WJX81_000045 [Elliptochloris bilobata]|uniref:PSI subunit V n=1 Tax=Elliptochloris bilobata TaxID=381761 RepID=A0AAW1RFZ7_9CHLO
MAAVMTSISSAVSRLSGRQSFGSLNGLKPAARSGSLARAPIVVRAEKSQVVQPINGDPFIGMLETPIGLAHGFFLPGPFIKLGPLRNVAETAEKAGCLSAAGLVVILALALTGYGATQFQQDAPTLGVKTLSGREVARDPLQSAGGWQKFAAGWTVGGLSGVAWAYILTQTLPYYF